MTITRYSLAFAALLAALPFQSFAQEATDSAAEEMSPARITTQAQVREREREREGFLSGLFGGGRDVADADRDRDRDRDRDHDGSGSGADSGGSDGGGSDGGGGGGGGNGGR